MVTERRKIYVHNGQENMFSLLNNIYSFWKENIQQVQMKHKVLQSVLLLRTT